MVTVAKSNTKRRSIASLAWELHDKAAGKAKKAGAGDDAPVPVDPVKAHRGAIERTKETLRRAAPKKPPKPAAKKKAARK